MDRQLRLWIKERNWEGFIVLCFKCNSGGQTSDIENVLEICQVTCSGWYTGNGRYWNQSFKGFVPLQTFRESYDDNKFLVRFLGEMITLSVISSFCNYQILD